MKPNDKVIKSAKRYMVVISGETASAGGKRLSGSGVGFGDNRETALADAKQNLSRRLPQWSEYLNNYIIIEEKEFFG
ncbi:hypothetical protein [Rhodoflexus sp.]